MPCPYLLILRARREAGHRDRHRRERQPDDCTGIGWGRGALGCRDRLDGEDAAPRAQAHGPGADREMCELRAITLGGGASDWSTTLSGASERPRRCGP
jgi:hypothetical protein